MPRKADERTADKIFTHVIGGIDKFYNSSLLEGERNLQDLSIPDLVTAIEHVVRIKKEWSKLEKKMNFELRVKIGQMEEEKNELKNVQTFDGYYY